MSGGLLWVQDIRYLGLVPRSRALRGSLVVSQHYGLTQRSAHRRALLAVARILEKDLTARYQH